MNKIIIIGGEGTALNIAEAITDAVKNYNYSAELLGFANDYSEKGPIGCFPIISKITEIDRYFRFNDVKFIFALYKPGLMNERTKLLQRLMLPTESQINFFHPSSYISSSADFGFGNVILQNCTIQNNVFFGNNNILSSNTVIEHDTKIGNNNFIAAGVVAGSNVNICDQCFIGLNSSIREQVQVSSNTFIGMGTLLLKNTNKNETWYGVPARKL